MSMGLIYFYGQVKENKIAVYLSDSLSSYQYNFVSRKYIVLRWDFFLTEAKALPHPLSKKRLSGF
jgi:hypothetical protein